MVICNTIRIFITNSVLKSKTYLGEELKYWYCCLHHFVCLLDIYWNFALVLFYLLTYCSIILEGKPTTNYLFKLDEYGSFHLLPIILVVEKIHSSKEDNFQINRWQKTILELFIDVINMKCHEQMVYYVTNNNILL